MAFNGEAFSRGFGGGISAVRDLTGLYVQTSEIFQDRAMKQKAQQVGLETQKQLEAIQGPVKLAEQKVMAYQQAIAKGEVQPDEAEAKKLAAELAEAQGMAAMQSLDLAMNTAAGNLGNQYIVDDMRALGQQAGGKLQMLWARAAQADEAALKREQMGMYREESELERVAEIDRIEAQRNAQLDAQDNAHANELEQIAARGEQDRLTQSEALKDPWTQIYKAGQLVDAELSKKSPQEWAKEAKAAGFGDDMESYARRVRAERLYDVTSSADISNEILDKLLEPPWFINPDEDAGKSPARLKAEQIREAIEKLSGSTDPRDIDRMERLEERAREMDELDAQGPSEEADALLEETFLGTVENFFRDIPLDMKGSLTRREPWGMTDKYAAERE